MLLRPLVGGLAGALAVVLTMAAGEAWAGSPWAPCEPTGYQCSVVDVPLDRTGAIPGTIGLSATRVVATNNPSHTAVVGLAGGPGQAALPVTALFAQALAPALANRDLLVFDQRGTGASGPLSCPRAMKSRVGAGAVSACAAEIGPARGSFTTADSVEDIEALRVAGGYDKLVLAGVSYGTKVALAYAARYPQRVESLVLDSVVLPEGEDVFRRSSLAALPRVLGELCSRAACRGITGSAARDIARLAQHLRRHALRGSAVDGHGRRVPVELTSTGLFQALVAGDLNPQLRAELPGSMRAALTGDSTPILRLLARAAGLGIGDEIPGEAINPVLYIATTCEDSALPWPRASTSRSERLAAARTAARAVPAAAFLPFNRTTGLVSGLVPTCLGWTEASPAPAPLTPLPQVPTLVLDGQADLRTPLEDAQQLAARIPGAQLVALPHTGHSTLTSDLSGCAQAAVVGFFGSGAAPPCQSTTNELPPTPRPPRSLAAVRPQHGVPGGAGQALAALRMTIQDAASEVTGVALAEAATPHRIGGLRAGYGLVRRHTIVMRRMSYVPGVEISGSFHFDGSSQLRIGGRSAPHGRVTVTKGGHVSGRIGGRRVRATLGRAARASVRPARLARAFTRSRLG
jgi:pimeloyl-ACP methyl ester carboxylesterase